MNSSLLSATNAFIQAANKTTTAQQMYAAAEQAVKSHSELNAEPEPTEEQKQKQWDEVLAKTFIENNLLQHLSSVPADEKEFNKELARAAMFIADSLHDRDIYHRTDTTAVKLYFIFFNRFFRAFCAIILFLLMCLALFEPPAVVSIPHGITQILEIIFVAIILARMCMFFRIYGWDNFKTNGWKIIKFILLIATIVDAAIEIPFPANIRVTRVLRPILLAEHFTVLRQRISLIFRTIMKMPEFLFLMIFNVIFYALIAYTLFSPNKADPYFKNLFESFISIFVLQTTANYPDVTIPSVTKHPAASLLFISFLLIQLYFVFNLNIATVFNIYKGELEERKVASYTRKRVAILAAFRMLDSEQHGYITLEKWKALFKTVRPWADEQKAVAKFEKENSGDTGKIGLLGFFTLCDQIMKKLDRPRRARKAANFIHFPLLLKIVSHKAFKFSIIVVTGLNCAFVVLQLIFEDYGHPSIWSKILEPLFIVIFTIELVLKLGGQGPKGFIRKKWNLYDTFVVVISIVGLILQFTQLPQYNATLVVAGMRLLRMTKFIRYFSISDRLRIIVDTFFEVVPSATTQIVIVLLWYYAYGVIGMECFAGKLQRDNPLLKGTDYDALNFYNVSNYDNILMAFLTAYHLTVVNNWHVTMKGLIAVTNRWACVYFIIFWLFTVVIFMNLVVATVLDIFSNQFTVKQNQLIAERLQAKYELEYRQGAPKDDVTSNVVTTEIQKTSDEEITVIVKDAELLEIDTRSLDAISQESDGL